MSDVKLENVLKLKKEAQKLRDEIISAKATMSEVEKNIESCKQELKDLGVSDPDKADEVLKKLKDNIEKLYSEADEKIKKWL